MTVFSAHAHGTVERRVAVSTTSASGSIISSLRGYPMANLEHGNGAGARKERYSYMLSEKSSLVFTVMLSRSKACLRCYGC